MPLSHHSLVAWQRADDLFIRIHVLCRTFPSVERYALSSQALHLAEASLAELGYCLHVARRLGYISEQAFGELEIEVKRAGAPLSGLIHRLAQASRV